MNKILPTELGVNDVRNDAHDVTENSEPGHRHAEARDIAIFFDRNPHVAPAHGETQTNVQRQPQQPRDDV